MPSPARAGTVEGRLSLPDPGQRGAPPVRTLGFVPRAKNALKPVKRYDPLPYMVVVLENGPVAAGDRDPDGRARYAIVGESFEAPILPVQAGAEIEIVNRGRNSPRLHAPAAPDLVGGQPLNPKGEVVATVTDTYRAVELRDRDSAHLQGTVVAFPHPYFSRVNSSGRFTIEGVPDGTWTARVWYRDGWLKIKPKRVQVSGSAKVTISIPPRLEVTAPDQDAGGGE